MIPLDGVMDCAICAELVCTDCHPDDLVACADEVRAHCPDHACPACADATWADDADDAAHDRRAEPAGWRCG